MLVSDLVMRLNALLVSKGDMEVVSGLSRSGYGETILKLEVNKDVFDTEGKKTTVLDIVFRDESLVADQPFGS